MTIELKVPALGESITEVEIGDWLKTQGEVVEKDEPVVSLESEKATLELPAPQTGVIKEVFKQKGQTAAVGETIAVLEEDGHGARHDVAGVKQAATPPIRGRAAPAPGLSAAPRGQTIPVPESESVSSEAPRVTPAAARALAENQLRAEEIKPSGPGGRILKEDVLHRVAQKRIEIEPPPLEEQPPVAPPAHQAAGREEEVVRMTRLRRTVAERLVAAQNSAALLTTFNEIDMTSVLGLRKEYGELFQQKYKTKLGFMSFFVKAVVDGLKLCPQLNAEIRGENIVYRNYYDIGVAIGGGKGLVVPVLRNAERMSFAEIERQIGEFAKRAKENKLLPEELQGGTFTISNGGIYGSLLSTPIVNPPQSGILGLHTIQDRPIALQGAVVIRPMMYVALTYDHRIVDGREAVGFLRRVKEVIETPTRLLIET